MVRLEPREILKRVEEEGFERVWRESTKLLPKPNRRPLKVVRQGEAHPIPELVQRLRQCFLRLGFTEVWNPIIVGSEDVYKQYGPEAAVILDRCFFLATLPRPEIGLSKEKEQQLVRMGIKLTDRKIQGLKAILRDYKKGTLASDDFLERLAEVLEVSDAEASAVLSQVFPEFLELKPIPSQLTLRSHMTTAWFRTLQALQFRLELPIRLFSIGVKFRREQREDPSHLRSSLTASCVVMDGDVNVEDGKQIVREILADLGLKRLRFVKKKITSRYYAPGTEYEAYCYSPVTKGWVEVANFGMYSPIALAHYDIEYPVLNVGLGVERIAMILKGEDDIRRLAYPQFYAEWTLSDQELARMVSIARVPRTAEGREVARSIIEVGLKHANEVGPCEVPAFRGRLFGRDVEVVLYEPDAGAALLGPAALNEVYVYDGNILAVPIKSKDRSIREVLKRGVKVGIRIFEAIANLAAAEVEEAARQGKPSVDLRVRIAKSASDVNIQISERAWRYVTGKKKRLDFRGPVFVGIRARIW